MREKLTVLPIEGKANQGLVDFVSSLLERCLTGDVIAVTVLEELPGGEYTVKASATQDRLHTAGALLDAAISRLQD